MMDPSSFAGEPYLSSKLPDYEKECGVLTVYLIVGWVFWFLVFPILVSKEVKLQTQAADASKGTAVAIQREVSLLANVVGLMGAMFTTVALILFLSPYNYYTPRRVFTFPLFTEQECEAIRTMADQAASMNYEEAHAWSLTMPNGTDLTPETDMKEAGTKEETFKTMLQPPLGWHKLRHGNYPTTDLNPITDPFTKEDRAVLTDLFHRRLAPTFERVYGVPARAFRAIDMFVVRYDEGIRTHLERHTDDGDVSFTILLNQDFEGGGTRVWRRQPHTTPFAHLQPTRAGTVLTHHALVDHEGYHVISGTRMIFVGFTSVDRKDPWTDTDTGLGWYASWLNLAWLHVKFKRGYFSNLNRLQRKKQNQATEQKWYDHTYARLLFRDLTNLMEYLGDVLSPHQVEHLVADENTEAFLRALDESYAKRPTKKPEQANWWKGQMVNLDFTGKVESYWNPRAENQNTFTEL